MPPCASGNRHGMAPRAASQARSLSNGIWKRCWCVQSDVGNWPDGVDLDTKPAPQIQDGFMLHAPPRRQWPRVSREQAGLRVKVSMIAAPREGRSCYVYEEPHRRRVRALLLFAQSAIELHSFGSARTLHLLHQNNFLLLSRSQIQDLHYKPQHNHKRNHAVHHSRIHDRCLRSRCRSEQHYFECCSRHLGLRCTEVRPSSRIARLE